MKTGCRQQNVNSKSQVDGHATPPDASQSDIWTPAV